MLGGDLSSNNKLYFFNIVNIDMRICMCVYRHTHTHMDTYITIWDFPKFVPKLTSRAFFS